MSGSPLVVVHADAGLLARSVADRLVTRLVEAQADRGRAHVVLTGGGMGSAVLRALDDGPGRDAVDWGRVHVWWGDERFLPSGHADRNETQARKALLDRLPLEPSHVHAMPASDGEGVRDVDEAAARYADELMRVAEQEGRGAKAPPSSTS